MIEKDIIDRLSQACSGHPSATIPWPHRLLHDAITEIRELRARLAAQDGVGNSDATSRPAIRKEDAA